MQMSPYVYWPLLILALTGVGIFFWDTLIDLSGRLFGEDECDHPLQAVGYDQEHAVWYCGNCGQAWPSQIFTGSTQFNQDPTIPDDNHEPKFKLIEGGRK